MVISIFDKTRGIYLNAKHLFIFGTNGMWYYVNNCHSVFTALNENNDAVTDCKYNVTDTFNYQKYVYKYGKNSNFILENFQLLIYAIPIGLVILNMFLFSLGYFFGTKSKYKSYKITDRG